MAMSGLCILSSRGSRKPRQPISSPSDPPNKRLMVKLASAIRPNRHMPPCRAETSHPPT